MRKWLPAIIVLGFFVLVGLYFIGTYNSFVRANESVAASWAQVQNQYQRRFDLIPNLVETVKGIASQEQQVFLGVTEARAKVGQIQISASDLDDPAVLSKFQNAQGELSGALSRLLAVSENYPILKSNENFLALQDQLEGTENRISVERMRFNEASKAYNVKAKSFPGNMFVGLFGFDTEKALFQASEGSSVPPAVKF